MGNTIQEPMEFGTYLYNDGWEFAKFPLHSTKEEVRQRAEAFAPVGLPHDWLIAQAGNLYEDGSGWYRKRLTVSGEALRENRLFVLRFEGIYMDSTVYVNDRKAAEWKYGYSTFETDITPYLTEGDNEILVRVNHQAPNSRWYSGAGIYRDVWLKILHPAHLVSDGSYVTTQKADGDIWELEAQTEVLAETTDNYTVEYRLWLMGDSMGEAGGRALFADGRETVEIPLKGAPGIQKAVMKTAVTRPLTWDVDRPGRYQLTVSLLCGGRLWQSETYTIGFRTIAFSPDQGFLLNGRKLKLRGVCEHHDLGCLGAAYNSRAMRRKLGILKDMGVNALRLAHNMPAPDVMELADEMGFLVVSEAFDMWERSKTPYDYARFFPEWYQRDVASWIRRDRNHPSVIMWSIGNEIYDTHACARGQTLTRLLTGEVRKHDPSCHAPVTIGSNYMPWEPAQMCADLIKLAGYNYSERYYDTHHREHPDWIIYGSETGSTVQSRGVYHFPYRQPMLADEDEQCSALGNSTTSWGAASPEACIIAERDHDFSCGQFLWTGFDYIGEPTPYHTRNSYFGQVDTAGFPKDSYYLYQAEWTDAKTSPMVHVFPYWDFNEGQLIDVRVCSNAAKVELFLNNESQGLFEIDHCHGTQLAGHWQIPYHKGVLLARAYDESGHVVAEEQRSSFGEASRIALKKDRDTLLGDGRDLGFVEISVEDDKGRPVENASNRVRVTVSGAGYLAGLDNGDSTDEEEYKTASRRLFNGKLLAVVAAEAAPGEIHVRVSGAGLSDATAVFTVLPQNVAKGIGRHPYAAQTGRMAGSDAPEEIPVRAIRLHGDCETTLGPKRAEATMTAVLHPAEADDRAVIWSAVNDAGIPSTLADVIPHGLEAKVTAKSDGRFKLRCMSRSGTNRIRVISELDFTVSGMGKAWLDPYSFLSAGLYDYSKGDVSNGNEHGVATARDRETQVGFSGIDFGAFGSDEITISVFALTDEAYPIQIWEGMPGEEGSQVVADVVYQRPSIWNVYQEETYHLKKRLSGVAGLCFVLHNKVHLKGFIFTRMRKAYQTLTAAECDFVYGDSFSREGSAIVRIGNNVTLRYEQMDFGEEGARSVTICGRTPMEKNGIQLRFVSEEGERVQMIEFSGTELAEQTFELVPEYGCCEVSFVFLPGSQFDFHSVCFHA